MGNLGHIDYPETRRTNKLPVKVSEGWSDQAVFKSGDILVNYRPISLVSNISKIVVKIIKQRIMSFCRKHSILSERQYGFQEGKSTDDAIHCLTKHIYETSDKSRSSLSVFVDLSKAFDTVCHKKLLEKLHSFGMRGNIYELLESYLSDREQRVCVGEELSDPMYVTYGVPQETVSTIFHDKMNVESMFEDISYLVLIAW